MDIGDVPEITKIGIESQKAFLHFNILRNHSITKLKLYPKIPSVSSSHMFEMKYPPFAWALDQNHISAGKLNAHLYTIRNPFISKLKTQKFNRSSSQMSERKIRSIYALLRIHGPKTKFWNFIALLQSICNHYITKLLQNLKNIK